MRWLLLAAGVPATAYGAALLLGRGWSDLAAVTVWLAAGVLLHDVVLAPLVLLAAAAGARRLPAGWRGPVAAGFVVLGSVTLLAVPVLGRFGARPDNPTLLDRPYGVGWALVAVLTLVGVAVAAGAPAILRRRRGRPGGASTRGR